MNNLSANVHAQSIDQTARPRPVSSAANLEETLSRTRVRLPSDRFTAHLPQTITLGEWKRAWAAAHGT